MGRPLFNGDSAIAQVVRLEWVEVLVVPEVDLVASVVDSLEDQDLQLAINVEVPITMLEIVKLKL
jgi:hypothetical protein